MKTLKLKLATIFALLLAATVASASGIEAQIRAAAPGLTVDQVTKVAASIRYSCRKHKIDCEIFTAILAQESRFKTNAYNKKTQDYGIAQINIKTIRVHKWDSKKLTSDVEYSIDKGAEVLAWFHKRYSHEPYWYCRYNNGTAPMSSARLTKCMKYVSNVNKFMRKVATAE